MNSSAPIDNKHGGMSLEGLDKVLKAFDAAAPQAQKAAMKGLQKGGMQILEDAMNNLRANGSVVTGLLRQSGKVQQTDDTTLEVGFFDTRNQEGGYAAYVEYGRKAGRMPPPDVLAAYAKKKFKLQNWQEAAAMGWAMAKRIAKQGTKPHPFFQPAIDKNKDKIIENVKDSLNNG